MFPAKLFFKSDNTIMELESEIIENKIPYGLYVYTEAKVLKGVEIKFSKSDIERLIRKDIATT